MSNKLVLILLPMILLRCNLSTKISIECKVLINQESVDFSSCYNGLTINELSVLDSVISLYPKKYQKVRAYQLVKDSNYNVSVNKIKIYFDQPNNHFKWEYYDTIIGHDKDDLYHDLPYQTKKIIGQFFKPNVWYLFNFYNPHFRYFVFVDKSNQLQVVKQTLNSNF